MKAVYVAALLTIAASACKPSSVSTKSAEPAANTVSGAFGFVLGQPVAPGYGTPNHDGIIDFNTKKPMPGRGMVWVDHRGLVTRIELDVQPLDLVDDIMKTTDSEAEQKLVELAKATTLALEERYGKGRKSTVQDETIVFGQEPRTVSVRYSEKFKILTVDYQDHDLTDKQFNLERAQEKARIDNTKKALSDVLAGSAVPQSNYPTSVTYTQNTQTGSHVTATEWQVASDHENIAFLLDGSLQHEWTFNTGKTVTGYFLSADASSVLIAKGGEHYKLPIKALTDADQKLAGELYQAKQKNER